MELDWMATVEAEKEETESEDLGSSDELGSTEVVIMDG